MSEFSEAMINLLHRQLIEAFEDEFGDIRYRATDAGIQLVRQNVGSGGSIGLCEQTDPIQLVKEKQL